MEAVVRNQSEHIRDESVIEYEIEFYLNSHQFIADIRDSLKENELDIRFPTTRFDGVRVYMHCPGTEEQALKRIEVREGLMSALERIKRRVERFDNALNQLEEEDQDLIFLFYFEKMDENKISRFLGFGNMKLMRQAREEALRRILDIYKKDREESESEYKEMKRQKREEMAKKIKQSLLEGKYGKAK